MIPGEIETAAGDIELNAGLLVGFDVDRFLVGVE